MFEKTVDSTKICATTHDIFYEMAQKPSKFFLHRFETEKKGKKGEKRGKRKKKGEKREKGEKEEKEGKRIQILIGAQNPGLVAKQVEQSRGETEAAAEPA